MKRANPLMSAAFAEINRELQALSTLRHPGIPQLFEAFQTNFGYFLVMELIEGGKITLGQCCVRHVSNYYASLCHKIAQSIGSESQNHQSHLTL